ncbi:hypothetical protein [Tepidibacillus sp. HK-1]|uniref:hypothetical protein n=1 Tax=Tepidibacillus sp. HK-1 TaxID=1883407 RepID=UPI00085397DC|nr:hypothetical protein [Tepidibacillus sp. HK-1]GBF12232.1 hypothetical protein HK1_02293 [Tepidibacillus sp. HK-1]
MLADIRTHESYLNFVVKQLDILFKNKTFLKDFYFEPIVWCSLVNLTDAAALLKHRYSTNPRGRKPRNPCDMLRSLLFMHYQHETSLDRWVFTLKTTPVFVILSDFSQDNVPNIGTFYDFFKRNFTLIQKGAAITTPNFYVKFRL